MAMSRLAEADGKGETIPRFLRRLPPSQRRYRSGASSTSCVRKRWWHDLDDPCEQCTGHDHDDPGEQCTRHDHDDLSRRDARSACHEPGRQDAGRGPTRNEPCWQDSWRRVYFTNGNGTKKRTETGTGTGTGRGTGTHPRTAETGRERGTILEQGRFFSLGIRRFRRRLRRTPSARVWSVAAASAAGGSENLRRAGCCVPARTRTRFRLKLLFNRTIVRYSPIAPIDGHVLVDHAVHAEPGAEPQRNRLLVESVESAESLDGRSRRGRPTPGSPVTPSMPDMAPRSNATTGVPQVMASTSLESPNDRQRRSERGQCATEEG